MNSFIRSVNLTLLKYVLILIAVQTCIAQISNAQQFSFSGGRKKHAISFALVRNLVIIPVYINNKGPFNFILDTGVGPLVITDATILQNFDLKNLRTVKINGLGKGLEIDALLSNEISARIGKASIDYIPTAILKEDILGLSNYVGTRIYGLIGYHFFKSFIVNINYSSKRLVFYLPEAKRRIRGERVPIQLINNKPYVNIDIDVPEIGTVTAKMVVDNGASHAISLESLNDKPFPVPSATIEANLGIGLSGPISGSIGRVPTMKIGSFVLKDVIASYPVYNDVAIKTLLLNRNGNLGADILTRFNTTFDYANEAMYLKKNQNFARPFDHDMSGIEVYVEDDGTPRFFISRIEPGSPAELAGILVNDELLSINFTNTSHLDLNDITKLFRADDGKVLFISLNRNGSLVIKMIKLKKRI